MYGSYGSYSSMGAVQMSAPMDISTRNLSTQQDASCAFPCWPRRSSLSESDCEEPATSYLSDEDLFPTDLEDDARSVSSAGSISSPISTSPQIMTEAELLEMQREREAYQKEMTRFLMNEKERRRQAAKRQRRGSSGSKKSPKSKLSAMTPIAEAGGE